MSLTYTVAHWLRLTPWERDQRKQADVIAELFDREEAEREPPLGRALDLGCGTGMQSIALARRGWEVTGIDTVPRALELARRRAVEAGVEVKLVCGDVTDLTAASVGPGFRFFLDFGCFHGLSDEQRAAYGREVTAVAAPSATLLMFAFAPGTPWPLPRGAGREEILAALSGWSVIDEQILESTLPRFLGKDDPRCYRLRRG